MFIAFTRSTSHAKICITCLKLTTLPRRIEKDHNWIVDTGRFVWYDFFCAVACIEFKAIIHESVDNFEN